MSTELLIFDFDGTIVHTAPDIVHAINEFMLRRDREPFTYESILPQIGYGLAPLLFKSFPEAQSDEKLFQSYVDEFVEIYESKYLDNPEIYEGLVDILDQWDGKISILSNKRERHIHPILKHIGLGHRPWVSIYGGDSLAESKPHPLPFETVLNDANCVAKNALMIGDGEPDIRGGNNAGIRTVAVTFGYGSKEMLAGLNPWKTIAKYSELLPLI